MPTSAQMTTIRRADVGIGPYKAIIGRPLAVGGVPPLAMRSHPGRNRYPMFFARYRYNTIIGSLLAVGGVPPLAMRSHLGRNRYPMFFARYRYKSIIGSLLAVEWTVKRLTGDSSAKPPENTTCHCEPARTLAWQSPKSEGIPTSPSAPRNDPYY